MNKVHVEHKAKRSYNPFAAVVITIGAFIGAQIVGAIVFGLLLVLIPGYGQLSGAEIEKKLTGDPWLYLLLIGIIDVIAFGVVRWFMKRRELGWRDIGFSRLKAEYVGFAAAGYAVAFVGSVVSLSVLSALFPGTDFNQEQSLGIPEVLSGLDLLPMFVALVVLTPLIEELLMRGFLYTNLRRRLSFGWATVLVSVWFGFAHINQADEGLFLSGAASFIVLSVVLCCLREKTQSIWPSIGVHMFQNGIAFMALYVWKVA
jgi:membrane protease YdiL (CAAX protease family)